MVVHWRLRIVEMPTNSSMSLLTSVNVGHVQVQVPHMGESMAGHWTPCNPAIIRTFTIRVVSTIGFVFPPCLLDLKRFPTKWANKTTLRNHRISTMFGLVVLAHNMNT